VSGPSRSTPAQVFLATGLGLVLAWLAKLVLVTLLVSGILAFILEPLVSLLSRARIPRPVGAFVAVCLGLGLFVGVGMASSARLMDFADDLPRYARHVRASLAPLQAQREKLAQTTDAVLPPNGVASQKAPLSVQNEGDKRSALVESLNSATEVLVAISFIPFLVYFMLSWQGHLKQACVGLFPADTQGHAAAVLGEIADRMRAFVAGNFFIGLVLAALSAGAFGYLSVPNFYLVGLLSGFLSIVPYLGVVFAVVPPLVADVEHMTVARAGSVVVAVLTLHLLALNVLYPKLIGRRLSLNPLTVTVALLFWGWFWGAMGLILAVPIMGALKAICDHVTPLKPWGRLLGE
jgi:predicted PurR-regulated permease PerM